MLTTSRAAAAFINTVLAMRSQNVRLSKRHPPLDPQEQELWELCAKINDRGFYTDGALLDGAAKNIEETRTNISAEISDLTGGTISTISKDKKLRAWLAEHGCELPNMQKKTIAAALERADLSPPAKRALELRQSGSHAAIHKIASINRHRGADGRIRGAFRFHGASTGRWTAHGTQVHNLKRPQTKDLDALVDKIIRRRRMHAVRDWRSWAGSHLRCARTPPHRRGLQRC